MKTHFSALVSIWAEGDRVCELTLCSQTFLKGNEKVILESENIFLRHFNGVVYFKTRLGILFIRYDVVKIASPKKYLGTCIENIMALATLSK